MQEPVNTAMLGLGLKYKTQFDKLLPVPFWIYEHLERWHYLSFLKTRKNMELLRQIHFQMLEPPGATRLRTSLLSKASPATSTPSFPITSLLIS